MPECVVLEAQSAGAHLKLVETRDIFHKGKEYRSREQSCSVKRNWRGKEFSCSLSRIARYSQGFYYPRSH